MTILEQQAWLGRWAYFHQKDEEAQNAIEALKESLKRLEEIEKGPQFEKYRDFIDVYFTWHKEHSGVDPRMTAAQGRALKEIITYLVSQSKTEDEDGALLAWEYILKNWSRLTKFLQNQVALTQINKNLTEILTQLRNGKDESASKKSKRDQLKSRIKQSRK